MSNVKILITDPNGAPREWTDLQTAVCYHARKKVRWEQGDVVATFRGGKNEYGMQSQIHVSPIIGVTGPLVGTKWMEATSKFVEREVLYARDRRMCCYCAHTFKYDRQLTIDHVMPKSRGGQNTWQNCVTSCYPCNHAKANRTPQEASMPMLYSPYVPTRAEKFIMRERHIMPSQMEFLLATVPKHSRIFGADGIAEAGGAVSYEQ